jgi:two-component system, OmpR family, response regulator
MVEEKLKVLLSEKNEDLGFVISDYLGRKNFEVDLVTAAELDSNQALLTDVKYNIYILDATIFTAKGFGAIDKVHEENSEAIVVLTKPNSLSLDRLYVENEIILSKPFGVHDLVSAIGTKKRSKGYIQKRGSMKRERQNVVNTTTYMIGNYKFEVQKFRLSIDDRTIELTTKEASLLLLIVEHANSFVDRNYILEKLWKTSKEDYGAKRSMDVYLCKLRQYLKDDPNIYIINIHGKGYKFIAPVSLV